MSDTKVKKNMNLKIYTAWFILLVVAPAFSQHITLGTCLDAAQKTAASTKKEEIELELGKLNAQIIKTGWLPQISLNGQSTYQSDVTELVVEIPNLRTNPINKDQYKTFVDINQLIYDGGASKIKATIRVVVGGLLAMIITFGIGKIFSVSGI